jgi:glycosyltransferase involved in cell wall biosynthesis
MLIGVDASRAVTPEPTGTENYSLHVIRALVAKARERHHFRLYLRDVPPEGLLPHGLTVEWRLVRPHRLWTHLGLGLELARHPPDVLYVPAHVVPLCCGVRAVATVHDLGYRYYPSTHTRRSRWYLEWSTRHNVGTAERIIVDSHATRADLQKLLGVSSDKVVVAYPAGSGQVTQVQDAQTIRGVQERYGLDGPYLMSVGTLHPRKNLGLLVDAFADLVTSGDAPRGLHLVLAGKKGWLWEPLLERIHERGLDERVICTGYVDHVELSALLTGAGAMVMPSLYEGFGLPILEAMACETPVICSNASSLPEVAGDAALYVEPDDRAGLQREMRRLLTDSELCQELIRRGRHRLRLFSWGQCAEAILGALEEVGERG